MPSKQELTSALSNVSADELVTRFTRVELEEMYKTLTGSPCHCCRSKMDVAKWTVRVIKELKHQSAYRKIIV